MTDTAADAQTPPGGEGERNLARRPRRFDAFKGQEAQVANLRLFVEAARKKAVALDHVLLYGPPGLGKTTLAQIIAAELDTGFKGATGPSLHKGADLAAVLTNLTPGDVLFIDEIHRLPPAVAEVLYSAMEDFFLDIIIGEGPGARSIRIDLPQFTLIGATTRSGLLSKPLLDRFGIHMRMDFYAEKTLMEIIRTYAQAIGVDIGEKSAAVIAASARGTPRVARRLLRRVADMALVEGETALKPDYTRGALERLGIDRRGLDALDRRYLELIIKQHRGGPVGIETIAATLCESADMVEDIIEPFLLRHAFIERTPRGRLVTRDGWEHISACAPRLV